MEWREALLRLVQEDIPIVEQPFQEIARRLNRNEEEVLQALSELKGEGIIRQISPIYDTRMLGYDSSLVAFKVPAETLEEVALFLNSHPGVSHNYERDHEFNLWFTIALPPDTPLGLEDTVKLMADRSRVKDFVLLRSVRTFKIGVRLGHEDIGEREEVEDRIRPYKPLNREEIEIVKATQGEMPIVQRPFLRWAQLIGVREEYLVDRMRDLKERGVLRRIGAILYHRRVGFRANGMAVWLVEKDRVEEVGRFIAGFKGVSHCYERTVKPPWSYNLFSMIHGKSKEDVERLVGKIAAEVKIEDYRVLYSIREFKKRRVRYYSEDFYLWYKGLMV